MADFLASNTRGSAWAWPWQMASGGIRVLPMFERLAGGNKYNAALAQTMACSALLAAGLTAGAGAIQYFARRNGMAESDNPAAKIQSKLTTSFDPLGGFSMKPSEGDYTEEPQPKQKKEKKKKAKQKKTASLDKSAWEIKKPGAFNLGTFASVGIPLAAFTVALGLTDMAVDKATGAMAKERIEDKLERRMALRNRLFTARAMNSRGNLLKKQLDSLNRQIDEEDILTKDAELKLTDLPGGEFISNVVAGAKEAPKLVSAAAGILATAIAGSSFIGMYQWTKANDPDNIKYKAIRKGLNEYAKSKAGMTPITIAEPNDAYFDLIEGKNEDKEEEDTAKAEAEAQITAALPARMQPSLGDVKFNNPVSISFD